MKTKYTIHFSQLVSHLTRQWLVWMVAFLALGATIVSAGNGAVGDTNIKYLGRWVFTNSAQYSSYWGGAYIKVNFSGTTVKSSWATPAITMRKLTMVHGSPTRTPRDA